MSQFIDHMSIKNKMKIHLIIDYNKFNKFTNKLTFMPASMVNVQKELKSLDVLELSSSIPATTLK